ncbi:hypothetical protein I7I51_05588, partial [Histoplasma capsulatum]
MWISDFILSQRFVFGSACWWLNQPSLGPYPFLNMGPGAASRFLAIFGISALQHHENLSLVRTILFAALSEMLVMDSGSNVGSHTSIVSKLGGMADLTMLVK